MSQPDEPVALHRYARIEKHVLELVDAGALRPGDRLPSLRRMGVKMRVSVPTVAQAYAELERNGVVEARERSGFYVRRDMRRLAPPPASPMPRPELVDMTRTGLVRTVLETNFCSDILPLSVGAPDPGLLPTCELSKMMRAVVREDPRGSSVYGDMTGHPELRKQVALRMMDAGVAATPDEIIVTTGAMEAISIAMRTLTRPGDIVLIPSPTYVCYLQMVDSLGLRAIEIPSHPCSGIDPACVADVTARFDVKACLFNFNFSNPDGSLTPDEAKREIVDILARKSIPLVEDDVYGDLHFTPRRPGLARQYDRKGLVLVCSSFSKTIAGGYRVGWLMPGAFHDRAMDHKHTSTLTSATPTQMAVAEFLRRGRYERHLRKLRAAMEKAMRTLQCHVNAAFPEGTRLCAPQGGASLWVALPEQVDSRAFFHRALDKGIGVVPGVILSFTDAYRNYVRINCRGIWNQEMEQGIATLGDLARDMAAAKPRH